MGAASVATVTAAQEPTGAIRGQVVDAAGGVALPDVRVYVEGTARGALTDAAGRYRLERVPVGARVVVFERIGARTQRSPVTVPASAELVLDVALAPQALPIADVVVSTTREGRALAQTPATVGVVTGETIRETRATHPSQLLGRVPGVWVNVTGGEGHMTAIRQPLTTDPVYLYLEDGVPTRSTGFFNHNALYEINLPQAERIEVVKGPTTALYGSDAIGGTINVESRPAVAAPGLEATLEGGAHGYARVLGSYAFTTDRSGLRADINATRTDGWRAGTAYDRQSGTLRWDHRRASGSSLKAVAAVSRIDQQTAGASRQGEAGYQDAPQRNLTPISFREVLAARVSVEYERPAVAGLFRITPFARYNAMDILPNWSLTYDPSIWETANRSLGLLTSYRHSFPPLDAIAIAGVDLDWSPGVHRERSIVPVREDGIFTRYTDGAPIYDYDVTFLGASAYLHAEASPTARVRVTGGLRYDRLAYDYDNRLGALQTGVHRRPASTAVDYSELTPKLGATLDLGRGASMFASWSRGFRAPSEGQVFRQGPAVNTVGLRPVRATSYEAGVRGGLAAVVRFELSAYRMAKHDDILAFQRPDDVRETQNAGETLHRGGEFGLGIDLPAHLVLEAALSYGRHTYEDWRPDVGTDYGGHEQESAPRTMGTSSVTWRPRDGSAIAVEWVHLGAYWLDAANTQKYAGHDLVNVRADWTITPQVTIFGRVNNLLDERYAENGGWSAFTGREFAPGLPRTLHAGAQLILRR